MANNTPLKWNRIFYKTITGKKYNFKEFYDGFYASDKIVNISVYMNANRIILNSIKSWKPTLTLESKIIRI